MSEPEITKINPRRVWDSRGNPTVEVEVHLACGAIGRAIAPAGASRGMREAIDLRDGGSALGGMDVKTAISNVTDIILPALSGMDASDQSAIDARLIELDGTSMKSHLGGNAMIATSLAVLHASAAASKRPLWRHIANITGHIPTLPLPEIQIFGGGAHAGRRVDVQDFMVMVPGAGDLDEVMEVTSEIYRAAGDIMRTKGKLGGVADEGGWWPVFDSNEEALETLVKSIEKAGEKPGDRVAISLDIAASEFCTNGKYKLALEQRELSADQMIELLGSWIERYPIVSIEDPLSEDDPGAMTAFTQAYGDRLQIIGDDYLVTNASLVNAAAREGACNAVLIKVNQAGTVTEAIACLKEAKANGFRNIVSARSGETEDLSIVHLAVGLDAGQLKVGSFTRSERMAKWNECLRIESDLKDGAFVKGAPLANTWWGDNNAMSETGVDLEHK